jgi:hypothetical protein
MNSYDNTAAPFELLGIDPNTGKPPKCRIASVDAARAVYRTIKDSDSASSRNRALIDAMFNGAPPFNQNDLLELGQGERTNLDFGDAASLKEQALASYYDLTSSVDVLARVKIDYGTAEQRAEWSQIVSEEFHNTLKEWQEFEINHQMLADNFVSHGVGICFFEDETDWKWKVAGLSEFRIPRGTKANEWDIEVATVEREFMAHELYAFIKDPKVAADLGWNVKMVRLALIHSCRDDSLEMSDWEKLEEELKNNDILYGNSRSKKIHVVHQWVREFSGKVSHLIFLKESLFDEDSQEEQFLFKRVNRFDAPTNCFVTFCYGIGNGSYHSIRGLGFKIYPFVQLLNRLRCGMVDGALLASALVVQPSDSGARALEDLTLSYYGPYALFPPGLKIVEKAVPDYRQNVLPVLGDLSANLQNRTIGFQAQAANTDGKARTAYEVRAQLQREAVLSSASINLFYHPWKRLLKEVYRRISSRNYNALLPGGREAVEFRRRCLARGVPSEAIHRFVSVEPVRAIGYGSPGLRQLAVDETMQVFGALDEAGRVNLLRDRIAARFGQEVVDRYLPKPETSLRPPIDDKVAVLENATMSTGSPIPVTPGENHFIHASRHLQALEQLQEGLAAGTNPQAALAALNIFLPHLAEHLEKLGPDEVRKDQVALMRQRLQQMAASRDRLESELTAAAKKQQEAEQAEMARAMQAEQARISEMERELESSRSLTPESQQKILQEQARFEMEVQRHQAKLALQQAEVAQKLKLKDAETAAKIQNAGRSAVPEIRS